MSEVIGDWYWMSLVLLVLVAVACWIATRVERHRLRKLLRTMGKDHLR